MESAWMEWSLDPLSLSLFPHRLFATDEVCGFSAAAGSIDSDDETADSAGVSASLRHA